MRKVSCFWFRVSSWKRQVTVTFPALGSDCHFLRGAIILCGSLILTAPAEAATYYASPSGSGTACSPSSPCSLPTALNSAGSGDVILLIDGVYYANTRFKPQRAGVVIQALNKHGAILRSSGAGEVVLQIEYSDTTVRGLRIDGETKNSTISIRDNNRNISNVLIEHSIVENSDRGAIALSGVFNTVSNVIIRHNLLVDTGFGGPGEAVYVGTSDTTLPGTNIGAQVYGNTFRRFTTGGFDLKPNTVGADVHHNIFEGQLYRPNPFKGANEGTFMVRNKGHRIHDNIVKDATDADGTIIGIAATDDNQVFNNVVKDIQGATAAVTTREAGPGGGASQVYNNTFCNMNTYGVSAQYGLIVRDNAFNAPLSSCNAEEQRILNEIQGLPGLNYGGTSPSPTLFLSASPLTITQGGSSTLTWNSTNTANCTASNGWSGTKATSGTQAVTPIGTTVYTLSCTGSGGSISQSVTVTVTLGTIRGDLDGSGTVNLADVRLLIEMIVGQAPPDIATADLDGDGQLSLGDVRELINILISP